MTDEDKKRIVSEPPPPTDEIDGEWEGGDDEQTLVRDVPEGVSKSQPVPSSTAVSGTAVAPISTPPKAASTPPKAASTPPKAASTPPKAAEASTPPEMKAAAPVDNEDDEDEEEDEEEDDGEEEAPVDNEDDEDEEEDEEEDEDEPAAASPVAAPGGDWLPEWAPYAVLAGLVGASIVFGLGLVGGATAAATEDDVKAEAPAASAVKKPLAKPSDHP